MKKHIYEFVVKAEDIDMNAHVNNVTYLEWMIQAARHHSKAVEFDYDRCMELGGTWVAKSHTIEYKNPSFEHDTLQMETWIEDIGKIMSTRHYIVTRARDNKLILEGETEWVFVDNERMRPMRIPTEIVDGFSQE